jgi:hypothetical protein
MEESVVVVRSSTDHIQQKFVTTVPVGPTVLTRSTVPGTQYLVHTRHLRIGYLYGTWYRLQAGSLPIYRPYGTVVPTVPGTVPVGQEK